MTVKAVIQALRRQHRIYHNSNELEKNAMAYKALLIAASTVRTHLTQSLHIFYKLLGNGWNPCVLHMQSVKQFVNTRAGISPALWGDSPKACFARALCGYSVSKDAICRDTWLLRNKVHPKNAEDQWRKWFAIRRITHGTEAYREALRTHIDWLNKIAKGQV